MHILLTAYQEFHDANGVSHAAVHIGVLYSFIALMLHTHDSTAHKRGAEVYLHSFLTLH
jgi:peptide deformylase